MSRLRLGRSGADGRAGWLLGEALVLVVVAGLVAVGMPGSAAPGEASPAPPSAADLLSNPAGDLLSNPAATTAPPTTDPAPPSPAADPANGTTADPTADPGPPGLSTTDPTATDTSDTDPPASVAAAPVPPDQPLALAASAPARLLVPTIGIDTSLVSLDLRADGAMQVPAAGFPAGWYTGAPTPGELGPAVLAGHVDWGGAAGVFSALHELTPGDRVTVERQDGSTAVFGVTRVAQFDKDAFPTDAVYGDLDHAGLRLITCGGAFDRGARSYVDNIVVFAELVEARPA